MVKKDASLRQREQLQAKIRLSDIDMSVKSSLHENNGTVDQLNPSQISAGLMSSKKLFKLTSNVHVKYLYFKSISVANHHSRAPTTEAIVQGPLKVNE